MTDERSTILFVDDEQSILNALRRVLRKENYRLFFCNSTDEAFELLKKEHVDIVVSDHLMPDMTGLEFVSLTKDLYPDMMRVILTGQADVELAVSAINQGNVHHFLIKPWNDLELKVILKQLLSRRQLELINAQLNATVAHQSKRIRELEKSHPGISQVERDEGGAIVLDLDEVV